eukprot:scaffold132189_cov41-Tisochrysis_lutea.AAC.4
MPSSPSSSSALASSSSEAAAKGLLDWQVTMISGSISGALATLARQPIQRLKWIRQVGPVEPVPYAVVLQRTLAEGGVLALFRGSTAGIFRNIPHSSIVYTMCATAQDAAKGPWQAS